VSTNSLSSRVNATPAAVLMCPRAARRARADRFSRERRGPIIPRAYL